MNKNYKKNINKKKRNKKIKNKNNKKKEEKKEEKKREIPTNLARILENKTLLSGVFKANTSNKGKSKDRIDSVKMEGSVGSIVNNIDYKVGFVFDTFENELANNNILFSLKGKVYCLDLDLKFGIGTKIIYTYSKAKMNVYSYNNFNFGGLVKYEGTFSDNYFNYDFYTGIDANTCVDAINVGCELSKIILGKSNNITKNTSDHDAYSILPYLNTIIDSRKSKIYSSYEFLNKKIGDKKYELDNFLINADLVKDKTLVF